MQVDGGLVTIGQLSSDGIVGLMVIGNGKPYLWLPVCAWLPGLSGIVCGLIVAWMLSAG
jgi:hypothetical protein